MTAEQNAPWWKTGILYNVYVRSFKDTNGDGVGDLTGVIEKMDYLSGVLGVDAIWLSGMLDSPWREFGFDVSDLQAVHPAMGTMETFDQLVREAHYRGLKVVIDFIPNHTSDLHNWFIESRSSRDNPRRDWYVWRDPKPDGTPPNNWLSLFGGPAWKWDEYTWQYYLHTFLEQQPDLNWRNPELRDAMFDVLRFWLDRGVDGFRVDAAHHIMKEPDLPDNPPTKPREIGGKRLAHEYQEHKYDREHPDLHEVYHQMRTLLDSYGDERPRAMFAEVHVSGGWPAWARYFGEGTQKEFHFPFFSGFIWVDWNANDVRKLVEEAEAALPEYGWPNAHTGNFDEWRVATRFGEQGARQAALLLLTMRGTPLLYYGEEIGMTNVAIPPEMAKDPFGKQVKLSRDPQRTPMQWDQGIYAGFAPPNTEKLWLPVGSNYRRVNVEKELEDPFSMLSLYRKLIAYRKLTPALQLGGYKAVDDAPENCYVYIRELGKQRLLVALNFNEHPVVVSLPDLGMGRVVLNTTLDRKGDVKMAGLNLAPKEGLLVELEAEG